MREGIEVKMFKVSREENHKVDLIAKLATSKTTEILRDVLMEIAEISCTKNMLVYTIAKRED